MENKQQILNELRQEFDRWDALLGSMEEDQVTKPRLPANLSLKDVVAHLWAWQQRSIERLDAALHNRVPSTPGWPSWLNPEVEQDLDAINAWIYATNRDRPWEEVYAGWRAGFRRFLELGEAIPDSELFEPGRYAWLGDYPLAAILTGSYDHHHSEHREPLLAWLEENGPL